MKLKHTVLAFFLLPLAYSCNQSGNNNQKGNISKTLIDTIKQCYTAAYEGDSAILNVRIIDSIKVEGNLLINYAEKPHNKGIVRGGFKGDTLFVDYSFKTGENPVEFSNPLVFLKKDGNLKMGVGQIATTLGRSYFAKDKPISFEKGKFNFTPTECK